MKKWLVAVLCAAVLCGCGGGDDETPGQGGGQGGNGGDGGTQQPVSPDEILPRRIVSADVTLVGDYTCTRLFDYDEQGRLVSLSDTDFRDAVQGYYPETMILRFVYDGNTITSKNDAYEDGTVYRLENGRAVRHRFEESYYWEESEYDYDAAGYLANLFTTFSDDDSETVNFTYTAGGFTMSWKTDDESYACTVEYDSARRNNLNLDLYGWDEIVEELNEFWSYSRLLGIAGERLRYLPAKMTTVYTFEENGKRYTDTSVTRFSYKTDGEYLSEVEVYYNDELSDRLVLHYE